MSKTRVYLLMAAISLLLVCLIAIQFFWLMRSSKAEAKEMSSQVSRVLQKVEAQLLSSLGCVELFTRYPLMPGDGFYIARQKHVNDRFTGSVDTVDMYYDFKEYKNGGPLDDIPYKYTSIKATYPVVIDMIITMNYSEIMDAAAVKNISRDNFLQFMTSKRPIDSMFNMVLLDSFLQTGFRNSGIETAYGFGIMDNAGKVLYANRVNDTAMLAETPHKVILFPENRFFNPVTLKVLFAPDMGLRSMGGLMLVSITVLFLLIFAVYAFIRMYVKQTRLSEMKSDFINNLTHEFNTPMSNISLAIETIEENSYSNPRLDKVLSIISAESRRLRGNIEMALQVAKMEKNKLHLDKEPVDLVTLINTIETSFQLQAEQFGGKVTFSHNGPAVVFGDETHLLNSICNVLDNAIKYRQGAPVIHISLYEKEPYVVLEITDNGIGMDAETQKRVFDKFYRAHEGNVHNTKGFGLGLSYVKGVIDAHNGKITVSGKPGKGTKVIITLLKHTYE